MADAAELCFKINAVCTVLCLLSAAALIANPPKSFVNQSKRYAQLCGVAFLSFGILSWSSRDSTTVSEQPL